MNRIDWIKTLKIALGSVLAIIIAGRMGLNYSSSAGIITLLTIQNTKKETIFLAGKRFIAFLIAVVLGSVIFQTLGYYTGAFGVFLLLFIGICSFFGLEGAISMNAVLCTHFLVDRDISPAAIGNEFAILTIGVIIGVILNLYIPRKVNEIRESQDQIELEMKFILKGISAYLMDQKKEFKLEYPFAELEDNIENALSKAYEESSNTLLSDVAYYFKYMEMRKSQCAVLKQMFKTVKLIDTNPVQAVHVARFIEAVVLSLRESNNAERMLVEIDSLKKVFRTNDPVGDRKEVEDRIKLLGVLYSMEQFLQIKRDFVRKLSESEIQTFWGEKY